jgi:ABC-type transport system involved in multi-copper enzyme maturation permease subunit
MDAPAASTQVKINRWLPYWAVVQADIRQTVGSWIYRTWVFVTVLVTVGYLLYRRGVAQEAGIIQPASLLISDLLRWTVFGSVTLIIALTASSISSERGTLADSVLSRGISRYQYFLGKWHARLVTVLGTFFLLGTGALVGSYFLLHEDLSLVGSALALLTVAALLIVVVSFGVSVSALSSSTVVGFAILWLTVYSGGVLLMLLPEHFPAPDRLLNRLPYILRGYYDLRSTGRLLGWSALISCVAALIGMVAFSRRDV